MTANADRLKARLAAVTDRYSLVGIALDALLKFNAHEAMARAAAIAFYSVLSIFPFGMIALVIASILIGEGPELYAFADRLASALGLDPASVSETLESLLEARTALAIVGIGLLFVAVVPWVSAVQRGIVRAFEEDRRSYVRTTLSSLLLLGMAAILILMSGVWGTLIGLVLGFLTQLLPDGALIDLALRVALQLLPVVVVFGVMVALLRAVPAHNPTFREVWLGALVTALGFLGLRIGFDLYVELFVIHSGTAAGSLGGILVGLLYIQFLAITMLAGAEVAGATLRRRRARARPEEPAPE
jgi:YihY family inner membrane protein